MDHGRQGQRRTLAERTAGVGDAVGGVPVGGVPVGGIDAGGAPAASTPDDAAGRPCWVGVAGATVPGVVHAWRRDSSSGQWEALVVAWVPAPAVRPR